MARSVRFVFPILTLMLVGCGGGAEATSRGAMSPTSNANVGAEERGQASYYADKFTGRPTASGERYDPKALTAAHRTLPFGTIVRVTRVSGGKSVEVKINDRGPHKAGRIVDLSRRAAEEIDLVRPGVADVVVEVVTLAPAKLPKKKARR